MSKLKLKNILSELLKEIDDTHPVHQKINDKLLQIAKRGEEAEERENVKEGEEKEYKVEYWYRYGKDGDDKDYDEIKVKASSESEAIEKAKQGARSKAIQSSFEIKK